MPRASKLVLTCALAAAAAGEAWAHDLWIEPSSYRPQRGETVSVRLRVGQDFTGDAVPADPAGIGLFALRGPRGDAPVVTRAGAEPAGSVQVQNLGLHAIGYRSLPAPVSEDAPTFGAFLRDAGLDDIVALRERQGDTNKRARQMFSRFAKSLLCVGPLAAPGRERGFDLRLELIAERDPCRSRSGMTFPVRLLFEGRPWAGALVTAISKAAPKEQVKARTDARGRVGLLLPHAGPWLLRAARVLRAGAPPAEWETLWASLTFELPAASTAAP